jgi:hypothetical protein
MHEVSGKRRRGTNLSRSARCHEKSPPVPYRPDGGRRIARCLLGRVTRSGGVMLEQRELNRRATWTEERLQRWLQAFLTGERIIVLANREPYMHERTADGRLLVRQSSSGLVTALEPIVRAGAGVGGARIRLRGPARRRSAGRSRRAARRRNTGCAASGSTSASSAATTTDSRTKRSGPCVIGRSSSRCFAPTTSKPIAA